MKKEEGKMKNEAKLLKQFWCHLLAAHTQLKLGVNERRLPGGKTTVGAAAGSFTSGLGAAPNGARERFIGSGFYKHAAPIGVDGRFNGANGCKHAAANAAKEAFKESGCHRHVVPNGTGGGNSNAALLGIGILVGHWSLVIGHWSLVIGHWSLVILTWSPGHPVTPSSN